MKVFGSKSKFGKIFNTPVLMIFCVCLFFPVAILPKIFIDSITTYKCNKYSLVFNEFKFKINYYFHNFNAVNMRAISKSTSNSFHLFYKITLPKCINILWKYTCSIGLGKIYQEGCFKKWPQSTMFGSWEKVRQECIH